jgi:hypothetical protein
VFCERGENLQLQKLKRSSSEAEFKGHGIVVAFSSKPSNERHVNPTSECLVGFGFLFKLRVLGLQIL